MIGNREYYRINVEHHMPPATWHLHHLDCLHLALEKSWGQARLHVVTVSKFGRKYGGNVILTSITGHNDTRWGEVQWEQQPAFAAMDGEVPSAGAFWIIVPWMAQSCAPNQQGIGILWKSVLVLLSLSHTLAIDSLPCWVTRILKTAGGRSLVQKISSAVERISFTRPHILPSFLAILGIWDRHLLYAWIGGRWTPPKQIDIFHHGGNDNSARC